MAFAFRQVTISGHRADTEGTSKLLDEVTDVLINEMGWILEDDRRAQAGNANITLTHKVVFNSNGGEAIDQQNWFFTLVSGTTSTVGSDFVSMQLHSAYDTGTHDTAASGVETPSAHASLQLGADSNGPYTLWISGNKDGVVLVTKSRGSVKSWMTAGRSQHFLDDTLEPFGIYINAVSTTYTAAQTSVRSIVGDTPIALQAGLDGEFLAYTLAATNEPRSGLGNSEGIWTALPLVHTADNTSPSQKGAIGICSNFWAATSNSTGIGEPTEFVVSGTGERYLAFGSATSLVIRKS